VSGGGADLSHSSEIQEFLSPWFTEGDTETWRIQWDTVTEQVQGHMRKCHMSLLQLRVPGPPSLLSFSLDFTRAQQAPR
jgi:hypothetical protein